MILPPYTQFGAFDSSRCHTRCKVNLAVTQEILTFVGKHPFLLFVCMMVSAFLQWPQDASDAIYVVSHSYDICLVTSKKDQLIKCKVVWLEFFPKAFFPFTWSILRTFFSKHFLYLVILRLSVVHIILTMGYHVLYIDGGYFKKDAEKLKLEQNIDEVSIFYF